MRLSIRWRLTLWNVLGLAGVLVAFAALVYGLLAHAHYERIDRGLLAEFRELKEDQGLTEEGRGRLRHWIAEAKEHETIFCIIYDARGRIFERTLELSANSVPPVPSVTSGDPQLHDAALPIVGRQRVLAGTIPSGEIPFTVVLMAPLEEVDRELGLLRTTLLLTVPAILAASGAWGYLMARKALAPMERLRRSTEDITVERLHRRLPIINPQDELGRLTETFNAMIGRLERSFAQIGRFTADASHELRTPLTAIRMEAEVALSKPLDLAEHQQLLASILEECDRLTRLTDQLLALAREDASAARQAWVPLDLAAIVGDVAEIMRPLAEAKRLRLRVEANGAARVCGDSARLREVFFNVLDNAIKYTPAGGEVEVRIGYNGPEVTATIRDTGIGIPAEHLPHVFGRFYRVDKARSRAEGGTGLGLSIAQSIVASHGGQIELASTLCQGTTCTVRLPAESKA
jgi:heavy metal sensor kinase